MAGFYLRNIGRGNKYGYSSIPKNILNISQQGLKWDSRMIKKSRAIGVNEETEDNILNTLYNQEKKDTNNTDYIAFFDTDYPQRREFLRKFAMNGEIEFVLDTITDEVITYDSNNYFAYPDTRNLKSVLKAEKSKEIVDYINASFKRVYYAFGFNNGHDAWFYVKKFLTDGFLAFEIIFDTDDSGGAKNIIGFKELDPITLQPEIRKDERGQDIRIWVQYKGVAGKERELVDGNLIYLSWAKGNFTSRLSYVERLVRVFNMLRTLENSRIIWNVQNAQKRLKFIIPTGAQSEVKAQTRVNRIMAQYKEEVTIDHDSGEVAINGQPNFSFAKTFFFPSKEGQQIEIDEIAHEGYDMNSTEQLKYFWQRFMLETKIPKSRFNFTGDTESKQWNPNETSLTFEEIAFSNYVNRIRSIIRELLLKPVWIQFCLKYPQFEKDKTLRSAIGLEYVDENIFKVAKERQIAKVGAETVSQLLQITTKKIINGQEIEVPYFNIRFLVEKYMEMNDNDLKLNDKYNKEYQKELSKNSEQSNEGEPEAEIEGNETPGETEMPEI